MACCNVRVTALVVLFVVCVTTDGAVTHTNSSCNELDVWSCLGEQAKSIVKKGNNLTALVTQVCPGNMTTCTQIQPLSNCSEEYRTGILALENSHKKAADALCENNAAPFKDVILTLNCWKIEDLRSCVEAINITTPILDLLTHRRRQQDWDLFNTELSKCIEGSRENTTDCKAADFGPVKKVIDIFFTQSPPPSSGSGVTSTASILTAFVSLLVSLAL
ncbi:uncharacterized protein LOC144150974 [Haemaphysalis longicornis]